MFDFISSRMQKAIAKANKKTQLKEEDILEITRDIRLALLEADVNLIVVKTFINSIKEKIIGQELMKQLNPGQQVVKIVQEELVHILGDKPKEININKKPFIIMMTGLQGGGKTTTVAKLASYYRKKQKLEKILLVAADIYRPAAVDQLITLAKEINVDYFAMKNETNVDIIVKNAINKAYEEKYELIIIDTAGRLSIDSELMDELKRVKNIAKPNEIFFVADALSGQDIINVAKTFNETVSITGSIITKLDSNARGGAALSICYLLKIPIVFIGTGEKVSNLDLFYPDRMADRILGMGDVLSLIATGPLVVVSSLIDAVVTALNPLIDILNGSLKTFFDWLSPKLDSAVSNLEDIAKLISGKVNQALSSLKEKLSPLTDLLSSMSEYVDNIFNKSDVLSEVEGGHFVGGFDEIYGSDNFGNKVNDFFGGIGNWFKDTFNAIGDIFSGRPSGRMLSANNYNTNTANVSVYTSSPTFDVESINQALGGKYNL